MIFTIPQPTPPHPTFNESSPLRSKRDSSDVRRLWQKDRAQTQLAIGLQGQVGALSRQVGRLRRRIVGGGGTTAAGTVRIEQWNPSPVKSYVTGNVVFFTPMGAAAATFYALPDSSGNSQTIPNGTQPDTGAPYWGKFPSGAPGAWL